MTQRYYPDEGTCAWHGPFEPGVDPYEGQDFDWPQQEPCTCDKREKK